MSDEMQPHHTNDDDIRIIRDAPRYISTNQVQTMRIDHDDSIKPLTPFTSRGNLLFPATFFSHLGICLRIEVDQSIEILFRHKFALGKGRITNPDCRPRLSLRYQSRENTGVAGTD
jgi:hypothetical protein